MMIVTMTITIMKITCASYLTSRTFHKITMIMIMIMMVLMMIMIMIMVMIIMTIKIMMTTTLIGLTFH